MQCPRCQARLLRVEFSEGETAPVCPGCNGAFFTREQAETVLEMGLEGVKAGPLAPILTRHPIPTEDALQCPVCDQPARRTAFAEGCNVDVDVCVDHGIWLDGGEFPRILEAFGLTH